MADESVRSLLATLGFEVDTTGADQFEARFKKLESTIGTLARKIDRFQPKFNKKKGKKVAFSFGKALKKGIVGGFESVKFKPGAKIGASLTSGLKKAFSIAKVAAIAGAAALAAVVTKGVLKFSSIELAELSLERRATKSPLNFKEIKKQLEDIRTTTKGVVGPLEALNILAAGLQTTGKFERALPLIESAIKIGKTTFGQTPEDVIRQFGTFVKTGTNLDELEQSNLIDRDMAEALGLAGTGFSKEAQRDRLVRLLKLLEAESATTDKFFDRYLTLTAAKGDRLGVLYNEGLATVGKTSIELLDQGLKAVGIDILGTATKLKKNITSKIQKPSGFSVVDTDSPEAIRRREERAARIKNESKTNNIIVNVNGTGLDSEQVGKEVVKQIGKIVKDTSDNIKRGDVSTGFPADEVPQ